MGFIRSRDLQAEVGPGMRETLAAGGSIAEGAIVKMSGTGVVVAGDRDLPVGVSVGKALTSGRAGGDVIATESLVVAFSGEADLVADVDITAGEYVKAGYLGKAAPALTATKSALTIKASTGGSFANQPANDGIEVVSSSALDTMQVDIYGTTNGGLTVVKETVTLTGTTAVATVKTNWGVCLGFEIPSGQPVAAGTITVREASGDATIATLTAGSRQKGIADVALASQRAFNHVISVIGDSATTKTVAVVGTAVDGTALKEAVVLTGATKVLFTNKFRTITKVLVGDLETARTGTFKTAARLDYSPTLVGLALETVAAGEKVATLLQISEPKGKLFTATEASIAISNTVTETAFSNASFTVPAGMLEMGKILRIRGQGIATGTNSTDTLAIKVKLGSTAVLTIPATDVADNDLFTFAVDVTPRAVAGATAACVAMGTYSIGPSASATVKAAQMASTNLATNGDLACTTTGTWSVASASNSCRLDQISCEIL